MADEYLLQEAKRTDITRFDLYYTAAMQGMLANQYTPVDEKDGRLCLAHIIDDAADYAINALQAADCELAQLQKDEPS